MIKIYVMNCMPIKFQLSSLINKKSFLKGRPSAPCKGRFAVLRRVDPHVCISCSSIYAYQIWAFHLDKQKSGAVSRPWGGLTHTNTHYCIPFCMNSMQTKFQRSILINDKILKIGGLRPPTKGRFAVHKRFSLHVSIYFSSIYAYQISDWW